MPSSAVQLPVELQLLILTFVPPVDLLLVCRFVCRSWKHEIDTSPTLQWLTWTTNDAYPPKSLRHLYSNPNCHCRDASYPCKHHPYTNTFELNPIAVFYMQRMWQKYLSAGCCDQQGKPKHLSGTHDMFQKKFYRAMSKDMTDSMTWLVFMNHLASGGQWKQFPDIKTLKERMEYEVDKFPVPSCALIRPQVGWVVQGNGNMDVGVYPDTTNWVDAEGRLFTHDSRPHDRLTTGMRDATRSFLMGMFRSDVVQKLKLAEWPGKNLEEGSVKDCYGVVISVRGSRIEVPVTDLPESVGGTDGGKPTDGGIKDTFFTLRFSFQPPYGVEVARGGVPELPHGNHIAMKPWRARKEYCT